MMKLLENSLSNQASSYNVMLTRVLALLSDLLSSNWKPFECFHENLPKAYLSCRRYFVGSIDILFLFLASQELRVELDKLLKQKIAQPDMKLSVGTGTDNKESELLRAIIDLITSEENTNWVRDWIEARYICH